MTKEDLLILHNIDFTAKSITRNISKSSFVIYCYYLQGYQGFPDGSDSKESSCNSGELGSVPQWRRCPGEGNGYPFQQSFLGNSMDRGVWQATVYRLQRVGHNLETVTFRMVSLPSICFQHIPLFFSLILVVILQYCVSFCCIEK